MPCGIKNGTFQYKPKNDSYCPKHAEIAAKKLINSGKQKSPVIIGKTLNNENGNVEETSTPAPKRGRNKRKVKKNQSQNSYESGGSQPNSQVNFAQCGNYGNLLSMDFDKKSVKISNFSVKSKFY